MKKRLTTYQRGIMERLRAGEHLSWDYRHATYQFFGGGKVPNVTFRSLRDAGLICELRSSREWVAVKKGDGDGVV